MFSVDDHQWMARALRLADRARYHAGPNPRVGCVLVRDGDLVGEGWHERTGGPHAEIEALRAAGDRARGATAYVTLEPCSHQGRTPPCAEALVEAGVARVVAAMEDPNPRVAGRGLAWLAGADIETASGLMTQQAEAVNPGFCARMRRGRPWVRLKLAGSLDGRTAMASGESRWITDQDARRDVHRLRARSSAVMTGIGTVLADDPSLTVRLDGEAAREAQPDRVVVDSALRFPEDARMLTLPGRTRVFTGSKDGARIAALERTGAEVTPVDASAGVASLHETLATLAADGANEVLVESGPVLAGALVRDKLVDEIVIYMAPHLMGDGGRGLFHLPGISEMRDRVDVRIGDIRAVGRDWRITAAPVYLDRQEGES